METINLVSSYFSISPSLVAVDEPAHYDLFINSSGVEGREKFVRIFRKGNVLTREDVNTFMTKYHRIYVAETERSLFLKSLCRVTGSTPVEKATVIKSAAIHHLQSLFDHQVTTEVLGRAITECRDVVEGMIDVVGDCRVDQLQDLIGSLSFHDFYTYDHSINVSMYCILIYRALQPGASREEIVQAGLGGLLHDLGKVRISTEILNAAGKLNDEQFAEIKKHPGYGSEMMEQVRASLPPNIDSTLVGRVILEHHENFDGTGYPRRLAGEQIHLFSRVTTIADFFDAITTKRSYHEPLGFDEALAVMAKTEGKKIDGNLFRFFVEHTQQMQIQKHLKTELPADFDPCQPRKELKLVVSQAPDETVDPLVGSIKLAAGEDGGVEGAGKIKFIDSGLKKTEVQGKVHNPGKKAG